MDLKATESAISVSGMPKEVTDYIWERKRKAFEVF